MALERFANTPTPAAPSTPWTTLNGAITSGALSLTVTSASAFPSLAQFRVLIDSEWILITAGAGTSTWTVTRGVDGSTPTAHAHGASIFHVLTAAALLRNPRSMTTLGDMEYMAADLGPARLAAPADGDYVTRWTSGVPSWIVAGGGGTPGGSDTQIQFNDGGAFGGSSSLTYVSGTGLTLLDHAAIGNAAAIDNGAPNYPSDDYPVILNLQQTYTSWSAFTVNFQQQTLLAPSSNQDPNSEFFGSYSEVRTVAGNTNVLGLACTLDDARLFHFAPVGWAFMRGYNLSLVHNSNATIGQMAGVRVEVTNNSTGTITRAAGLEIFAGSNADTGTITDSAGILLRSPFNAGTVTRHAAIDIENQTLSGANPQFAIYYAAPASKTFSVAANGDLVLQGHAVTFAGAATLSGTNTGDQTSVSGNAGTATALQTARLINGVSFDGTSDITIPGGSGDVVGPASSVDNSIVRFDSTTGKLVQGYTSGAPTIGDTGQLLVANGDAAAPVYSSTSFPGTGFYFGSATSIRIAHSGSQTGTIGSADWSIISSSAQFGLGTDASATVLRRGGSHITDLIGRTNTNAQTFRPYGYYASDTSRAYGAVQCVKEAITLSGATTATTNIIPKGAFVIGVAITITTTITGASGYQAGDGGDADRYGDITGTAVGTDSDNTDATADPTGYNAAAAAVTLTAKTSNFTGGVAQVVVFFLSTGAD